MKRALVFALLAIFTVAGVAMRGTMAEAQEAKEGAAKKASRWTGTIVRSDKDAGTLTVRKDGGTAEKIIHYGSETKWTKQEKGKVEPIDPSQVKDGDRVICVGGYDEKSQFHADRIDLRLPH